MKRKYKEGIEISVLKKDKEEVEFIVPYTLYPENVGGITPSERPEHTVIHLNGGQILSPINYKKLKKLINDYKKDRAGQV